MEYIFFEVALRDKFVEYAESLALPSLLRDDKMGMIVELSDDLSDEQIDVLEAKYDELQDEQSHLLAQTDGGFNSLAGFKLELPDGQICMVPLQPDMANRLLTYFSLEEIQTLFNTIARSALDPQEVHLCKILKGAKKIS
jgi:hypothetical protein